MLVNEVRANNQRPQITHHWYGQGERKLILETISALSIRRGVQYVSHYLTMANNLVVS
jgi:hypothetical protein